MKYTNIIYLKNRAENIQNVSDTNLCERMVEKTNSETDNIHLKNREGMTELFIPFSSVNYIQTIKEEE